MGGDLKNRVRMGITLDKELYERLKAYSDQSMIPMSRLAERTIKNYLEDDFPIHIEALFNDFLRICADEVERAWYRGMECEADPEDVKDEIKDFWSDEKEDVLQTLRDAIKDYR